MSRAILCPLACVLALVALPADEASARRPRPNRQAIAAAPCAAAVPLSGARAALNACPCWPGRDVCACRLGGCVCAKDCYCAPDSRCKTASAEAAAPVASANPLLSLHNAERAKRGSPPLRLDARLVKAAQDHAEQMARRYRLAHSGIGDGSMSSRISATGYQWSACAENIAAGQQGAAEVVASWMGSAGHRGSILSRTYRDCGFGVATSAGVTYWCAMFARQF